MKLRDMLCLSVLLVCDGRHANASGGAVNLDLGRVLKEYGVQTVFVGEVIGFEKSRVHGTRALDESKPDRRRFFKYSYVRIGFRATPRESLRGTVPIGKPMELVFREHDFGCNVTLKPDGTTEETQIELGIISAGSGGEAKSEFCQLGKKCVFFVAKAEGERHRKLLRVEHSDEKNLQRIKALLDRE